MDDIWAFVEAKLNAPVPAYFKSVLKICGYNNGISISLIGAEDVKYMEEEVKNGNVGKAWQGEGDYLKDSTRKAEDFQFVLGHKKFLMAIVTFLKKYIDENGPDSLTLNEKHSNNKKIKTKAASSLPSKGKKDKMPGIPSRKRVGKKDPRVTPLVKHAMLTNLQPQARSSTVPMEVLNGHRQVLLERTICSILSFTENLFNEKIETVKEKLSGDFLTFELDDDCEDTLAIVKCVYCPKPLTVYLRPTLKNPKIWKIPNFDRHLRFVHRFESEPPEEDDSGSDLEIESKKPVEPKRKLQKESSDSDEEQSPGYDSNDAMSNLDDVVEEDKKISGDVGREIVVCDSGHNIRKEPLGDSEKKKKLASAGQSQQKQTMDENQNVEGNTKNSQEKRMEATSVEEVVKVVSQTEPNEKETIDGMSIGIDLGVKARQQIKTNSGTSKHTKTSIVSHQTGSSSEPISKASLQEFYIMRNGFKSRHDNKLIVTTNTCAFDAIMHSFASICLHYSNVRDRLTGSSSKISELLKNIFRPTGPTVQVPFSQDVLADRNRILKDLYDGWCTGGSTERNVDTTFIDCKVGIGGLFARVCKLEENFASFILERTCIKCGANSKKTNPFLKTTEKIRNLREVERYLDIEPQEKACLKCKGNCKVEIHFNNVVVLETEPKTVHRNETITLENITPELLIGSSTYKLCAVMHYEAKKEHFVAFVNDIGDNWKCLDDVKKNIQKSNADTAVNPFILCYASATNHSDFPKSVEAKSVLNNAPIAKKQTSSLPQKKYNPQDKPREKPETATKTALAAPRNESNAEVKLENQSVSKKRKKKRQSGKNKKNKTEFPFHKTKHLEKKLVLPSNSQVVTEYGNLLGEVERLKGEIEAVRVKHDKIDAQMDSIAKKWSDMILKTVTEINRNFSNFMELMGFAGEVQLSRPNERDFADYGIAIRVKYRNDEQLQGLDRFVQSGGERTVAIAAYTLSLQQMTHVPFRCVDEINQGMDPTNERRIFDMLVKEAAQPGKSQFFFVTPKLLMNMSYNEYMTVSIVFNGRFVQNASIFQKLDRPN